MPGRKLFRQTARVNFREKIISWDDLPAWRAAWRERGKKLVVTNGCFDLLHLGHVVYLEDARSLGDALLVGVNTDDSVRELKGAGRPLNTQTDRAAVDRLLDVSNPSVTLTTLGKAARALGRKVKIELVPA